MNEKKNVETLNVTKCQWKIKETKAEKSWNRDIKTIVLFLTKQYLLKPCFIFKSVADKCKVKQTNCYSITVDETVFNVSMVKALNKIKLLPFFQRNTRVRIKTSTQVCLSTWFDAV